MDVSKFDFDGAWIEVVVQSDRVLEPFRFRVQPIGFAESMAAFGGKVLDTMLTLFISAVVGWDLVSDGQPLPCDEETKRKYLSRFATFMVKSINGVEPKSDTGLAVAVIDFCGKPDNFLKN